MKSSSRKKSRTRSLPDRDKPASSKAISSEGANRAVINENSLEGLPLSTLMLWGISAALTSAAIKTLFVAVDDPELSFTDSLLLPALGADIILITIFFRLADTKFYRTIGSLFFPVAASFWLQVLCVYGIGYFPTCFHILVAVVLFTSSRLLIFGADRTERITGLVASLLLGWGIWVATYTSGHSSTPIGRVVSLVTPILILGLSLAHAGLLFRLGRAIRVPELRATGKVLKITLITLSITTLVGLAWFALAPLGSNQKDSYPERLLQAALDRDSHLQTAMIIKAWLTAAIITTFLKAVFTHWKSASEKNGPNLTDLEPAAEK